MSGLKIGSLFSGVGGLDLAVEQFFNAETKWHCEWEPEPSKVLAARWPGVPNFGDVTAVDWSTVEPVDIICGGFPCQDLSLAGRRSGMRPGTRSGLWADFLRAIDALKPKVVVIENVRGLLSGCAESASDSELGLCPRCVDPDGGSSHTPNVRALGRVLGDLSELGFDAEWHGLLASDVGAPHPRFRVFVLAYAKGERFEWGWPAREWGAGLANPRDRVDLTLFPTPAAMNPNDGEGSETWLARRERVKLTAKNGNGMPLAIAVQLLPTPMVGSTNPAAHGQISGDFRKRMDSALANWGDYEPAVRRWESLTRPAPAPTLADGRNSNHRLAAVFPEWMMGYSAGWATDVIGRNPAIKACGNGVVPQQAHAALGVLWNRALEWIEAAA